MKYGLRRVRLRRFSGFVSRLTQPDLSRGASYWCASQHVTSYRSLFRPEKRCLSIWGFRNRTTWYTGAGLGTACAWRGESGAVRLQSLGALVLGITLVAVGALALRSGWGAAGAIPMVIGGCLCCVAWRGGRVALVVFGHACVVVGCFLITWGMYLLPDCQPTLAHILGRPLFWGLFSMMGGICAIYHRFCRCVRG